MKARALFCTLAAIGIAHAAEEKPQCKLMRVDEWQLRPAAPVPTLDGFVNRHKIPVVVDTGIEAREGALLERAAAQRLGVPLRPYPGHAFAGTGRELDTEIGIIDELRIGQATRRNWPVLVQGARQGHAGSLVLGNAFFEDFELEFDLAQDAVRLFKSSDCRGVSLAYWAKERASEVPIWIDRHITLEVLVNGRPVRAVLDSGMSTSVLDTPVAARLGATQTRPGTPPAGCLSGQFESFTIGDEKIRNPRLYSTDLRSAKYDRPEMILGADFLRTHRVIIARAQRKLFFTYAGGTVFPTRPADACL